MTELNLTELKATLKECLLTDVWMKESGISILCNFFGHKKTMAYGFMCITWMNLENVMLSGRSWIEKAT